MCFLYHADYDTTVFTAKLNSIVYPDPKTWAWIEHIDRWQFGFIQDVVLEPSERGMIFSESGELKWRRLKHDLWRVVFLGTALWSGIEDMNDASYLLYELEVHKERQVLWGQFQSNIERWIELRIPHRFQYPADKSTNVCLRLEVWRSKADGYVHYQRYYSVEPFEEG